MALKTNARAKTLNERLSDLEASIRAYNPGFDFNDVRAALGWAKPKKTGSAKGRTGHNDLFADALLIAENIVEYAKADRETLLAAILYPSIRPVDKRNMPDMEKLAEIEDRFGVQVRSAIEDTLRFRALKLSAQGEPAQPLPLEEQRAKEENLRLFRLMGLWLARGPRAILIYGTQLAINLKSEINTRGSFRREKRDAMLKTANLFVAPLAYIAGYERLRQDLLDLCYRVEDPDGYAQTRRDIDEAARGKEIADVKSALIARVQEKFGWHVGHNFDVEIRPKPAASAHIKAMSKGQHVKSLGDLCGVRIILKKSVIEGAEDLDLRTLQEPYRSELHKDLGEKCMRVYGTLCRTYGRGNKTASHKRPALDANRKPILDENRAPKMEDYPYIQERLAELAVIEPREGDPSRRNEDPKRLEWERNKYSKIGDARFDDYIEWPKLSGYSAVQDTFFVTIPGRDKPVEIECQIVDEMRHDHNMYGPRAGRVYFKSGLAPHTDTVLDWYAMANMQVAGRPYKARAKIYVFDEENKKVVDISEDPTLRGFFAATGRECAQEARIYNGHEFPARDTGNVTYGPSTKLMNGCRIATPSAE